MMSTLFAEFCKLVSVRSTYVITGLGLLLTGFISFWGTGYKGPDVFSVDALQNAIYNNITIVAIFIGIVAILLICHEYRYNTISYTLTASNSRLKVLLAKFMVVGAYAVTVTLFSILWIIGLVTLGAHIAGHAFPTQALDMYSMLWKTLAYMVGGAWFGLILGFLSRSVVFAIVAYFVFPAIEPLLHMLLKISNNYMPNSAQGQILQTVSSPDVYTPLASAGVFGAYLLGLFIVATVLFLRKDASAG